jgi:RNA polymerase sigma-70 factor, ECF subfamily
MDAPTTTDEALMLRYQSGEVGAFETLYSRHKGPVYRYFVRHIGDTGAAEELYQETWMRVIGARERYTHSARFTTWLYRIAHNLAVDHLRLKTHRGADESLDFDSTNTPESARLGESRQPEQLAHHRSRVERLLELIDELPDAQREAFLLHQEAGMTAVQIAEATGVDPEAAKSRLRYATAALRRGMSS